MWDDSGNSFLVGAGPTTTVLDPDGTPNNIIDITLGATVEVNWSFSGPGTGALNLAQFTVTLVADPVLPPPPENTIIGTLVVPGTVTVTPPGSTPYNAAFAIAPNQLPVGAYRLTTLITCDEGGVSVAVAGFVDGPIIQVRPGP
jgi:hypothetical protein